MRLLPNCVLSCGKTRNHHVMCLYFLTTPIHIRYAIAEGNNRILADSGVRERHQMRAATVLVNQQNIRDTLIPIYGCNTRIALGPMVITFSVKVSYFNGPCEHSHTHAYILRVFKRKQQPSVSVCLRAYVFFPLSHARLHIHTQTSASSDGAFVPNRFGFLIPFSMVHGKSKPVDS